MIKQAIILAAGPGTRLRPLTDNCPKPMLQINSKPLLVYQLQALACAGIEQVIIHVAYLADAIINTIGDGKQYGLDLRIRYARSDIPLETGGGLASSIQMLSDQNEPFICVNGKIFTDYNYSHLANINLGNNIAHFILVPNPAENVKGDYNLSEHNYLKKLTSLTNLRSLMNNRHDYTFSGIAVYDTQSLKQQLASVKEEKFSIIQIINNNLSQVSGSVYNGLWYGLETVDQYLSVNKAHSSTKIEDRIV